MKISGYGSVQAYSSAYQTAAGSGEQPAKPAKTDDRLEISTAAKRLQGSHKFDETRNEKIEQLKSQIENGTYEVPAQNIAEKMYHYWNRQ
ncbi:flagellar biosynthesis anti-sigma factor FlgM [Sporolactobacillus sp. CPB3-1]|uniref:Negative regulator of flagellin synthesis n=1 Tax=Sporolactobacillus mangiferae TaxID=2940498 RepID=A0ABT0MCQ5_9BACL|nr:flagellar biosynthesis anti-sigma factor FlgM [Sporolactobacillus mangiferae]MCL1632655.1 flagellar biosynthesis anti-sigma factor FlgM [Sporolactobacillus mangiferae]